MSTSLLNTKLYIPPPHLNLVNRARLHTRLQAGLHGKVTLVSAPAGFGKTTLVSAWVQSCRRPVAWLALEAEDREPNRFWSYVVAALQTVAPTVGQGILRLLQSPQPPTTERLLTALLNEISVLPEPVVLILDDYHVLDAQPIDVALSFLIDHLPPQLHLVIITREDPNLPLAKLRARGRLTELRARDLRFTAEEAAQFLSQILGFPLTEQDVVALETRTEGWVAGLQLAALSLQGYHAGGQQSVSAFIDSFTGSHRFVMDYLVEEVLQQQPQLIQDFLLQTAILDRLCGPLCDAVLAAEPGSSQRMLGILEAANMFLVPLDNERHWYRYHHLFADLLRQRLTQQEQTVAAYPTAVYHRRAARWYEAEGMDQDAFHHATTANDIDHAIQLIQGKETPLHFRGALPAVMTWLQSLSPTVMDTRPVLWVTYASVLTMTGQPTPHVEATLCAAETALTQDDLELSQAVVDDLHGEIASLRAMLGIAANDADAIRAQSQRALEFLAPDNLPIRTSATWTLGFAYQLKGERSAAAKAHRQAIAISEQSGNMMMLMAAATCLGQVQESEMQPSQAVASYQQVVTVAGDPPWPAACEAHHGLGRIYYQWNQLDKAQAHGELGLQLAHQLPNVDTPATCMALLARVKLANGDVVGAEQLLQEAEQFLADRNMGQWIPQIASIRVMLLLRQGAITEAADYARQRELPLSQAQVHLVQGDAAAALALLEPLYREVTAKGWHDEQLKLLVCQAVAQQSLGAVDQALALLTDALTVAEPSEYVRIFIDEGAPMAQLLQVAAQQGIKPAYVQSLLAAYAEQAIPATTGSAPVKFIAAQPLIEALSEREIEVLDLIAKGLSNREIGERLYIAVDTVKGHNRKIFGKLQVQRRTEAIARARELGLLT